MSEKDDSKITAKDIYEMLWKCRDLELSTLWQRALMLGTFLALTYTGYGALMLQKIGGGCCVGGAFFHLIALGIASFGLLFSILWIVMMKGSKAWYERYEAAINVFAKQYGESIVAVDKFDVAFRLPNCNEARDEGPALCNRLLSLKAGAYSPGRVVIAIGCVSFMTWCLILGAHAAVIACGWSCVVKWMEQCAHFLTALSILSVPLVVWYCKQILKSSTLEK